MPRATDFESCGVCGRTILRGERTTEYATPDGARISTCALCKAAAEEAGWVPAAFASTLSSQNQRRRRGLGLSQRFAKASRAVRSRAARPAREQEAGSEAAQPTDAAPPVKPEPRPERAERRRAPQPQGRRREPSEPAPAKPRRRGREADAEEPGSRRGRHESPAAEEPPRPKPAPSPEQLARRAVEAFNASEERRKVAGLIRSLGSPQVSVRPDSGSVLVTVAWELSWYRWEVGGGDDVREAGKGSEIAELPAEAQDWNATAEEDGSLRLGAAPAAAEDEAEPR